MKHTTIKIFDCHDMPQKVLVAFRDFCNQPEKYTDWNIWNKRNDFSRTKPILSKLVVDDWLVENGAEYPKDDCAFGEAVLIRWWW
jgi:hypothetical protein